MHTFLSRAALSVVSVLAVLSPLRAFAYVSPDEVFGSAPPTQREGDSVVEERQRRAAERRAAEQEALVSIQEEPEPEAVHTDAPETEDPDSSPSLLNEEGQYERRQQRMEERSNGVTIIIGTDGSITDSSGNVLHSGAPIISKTGPESVLAVAAVILATLSTFAYAALRGRKMYRI